MNFTFVELIIAFLIVFFSVYILVNRICACIEKTCTAKYISNACTGKDISELMDKMFKDQKDGNKSL